MSPAVAIDVCVGGTTNDQVLYFYVGLLKGFQTGAKEDTKESEKTLPFESSSSGYSVFP